MINPRHLKELVIEPTLECLGMHSGSAVNLLLGTAAQESGMGYYLAQVNKYGDPVGPALGIYQMETATHTDLWKNYINREDKSNLANKLYEIYGLFGSGGGNMIADLSYATAMARLHYWRQSEPLPDKDDIPGLARYWKKFFNTEKGKGAEVEFIANYYKYVKGAGL